MKTLNLRFFATAGLLGSAILLTACSTSPSPWAQNASPWDHRRQQQSAEAAPAPSADEYKQDLAAVDTDSGTDSSQVEMNYQTGKVESDMPTEAPSDSMEPPAAASTATAEPEAMAASSGDISAVDEIKSRPGSYYTVQVIASVDKDRVYKFAEKNQLSVRYIVPTHRDGTVWHVLLLDLYPDYASARAAADEAAATLPTKPWVRKLASVQKLLN